MPGRKNRFLLLLAIALIVQGALSSAWATTRCTARAHCDPQASSPCPMGLHMGLHNAPCEGMSEDCNEAAASKIICEEGCARVFSMAPAVPAFLPDAPPAHAAGIATVALIDAPRTVIGSSARLASSSRGSPPLYLSTHSLLI
jgi:hypothetical protein